jgi:hypothetical protein
MGYNRDGVCLLCGTSSLEMQFWSQVVSCKRLTMEDRVRSQVSQRETGGGQSGTEACFSPGTPILHFAFTTRIDGRSLGFLHKPILFRKIEKRSTDFN